MGIDITLIIMGFALLIYGADRLVKGCSDIAKKFHIPEIIIGLTIVAIGTSMPELIITVTSSLTGHTDLIIGNAIGSDICNFLLILGFIAICRPVIMDKETRRIHLPAAIISTIMLMVMANITSGFHISRIEGIILLVFGISYFSYPIYTEVKDIIKARKDKEESEEAKKIKVWLAIVNVVVGIILLKYGSDFVVNNTTAIAKNFGIAESVIGLTIIAVGTALPEIVTSIVALIRKDTDMAVRKLNRFFCFKFLFDNWNRSSYVSICICSKIQCGFNIPIDYHSFNMDYYFNQ